MNPGFGQSEDCYAIAIRGKIPAEISIRTDMEPDQLSSATFYWIKCRENDLLPIATPLADHTQSCWSPGAPWRSVDPCCQDNLSCAAGCRNAHQRYRRRRAGLRRLYYI